jgi:hypothetical protein
MLISDLLSLILQFMINATLCVGLILLLRKMNRVTALLTLFLFVELTMELYDMACRLFHWNTINTENYPFSQFFGLVLLTELYARHFLKIPKMIMAAVRIYALGALALHMIGGSGFTTVTFYDNVVNSSAICGFASAYFLKTLRKGRVEISLFILNTLVFLFFSVESVISITFNFLVSHCLAWVAPIWIFRGVLLLSFYIAFINLGCRIAKPTT